MSGFTNEQKQELAAMFAAALGGNLVVEPEPIDPSVPAPNGPLVGALNGTLLVYQYGWMLSDFSADRENLFTRSDIYEFMALVISYGIDTNADWVKGSVPSWRFTKEAFMTRAAEISGDVMTTEFAPFESSPSSNGVDYGVTAYFMNLITVVIRKIVGNLKAQSADRDRGPNDELLTNGECVRVAYVALDAITDSRIVPYDSNSNFMKVRMECYKQYKAMGEGTFGPWSHPGGSVPWSWG